jgi:hypothetical protein
MPPITQLGNRSRVCADRREPGIFYFTVISFPSAEIRIGRAIKYYIHINELCYPI